MASWAHPRIHAVCAPGLAPRLGLSSWPARYLLVREMIKSQVKLLTRFCTAASATLYINSLRTAHIIYNLTATVVIFALHTGLSVSSMAVFTLGAFSCIDTIQPQSSRVAHPSSRHNTNRHTLHYTTNRSSITSSRRVPVACCCADCQMDRAALTDYQSKRHSHELLDSTGTTTACTFMDNP